MRAGARQLHPIWSAWLGNSVFEKDRQKGSPAVYLRQGDGVRVVIPIHKGRVIKPKTLAGIINDLGLTIKEFEEMI
ncbi:MAG: type II toxin-antitoxin system HicA family toxin [candidate division KSB1 bacterium]|nr:type II toxin-antitoxin system HicA family toxin [candidate division KSB1 bacterium]